MKLNEYLDIKEVPVRVEIRDINNYIIGCWNVGDYDGTDFDPMSDYCKFLFLGEKHEIYRYIVGSNSANILVTYFVDREKSNEINSLGHYLSNKEKFDLDVDSISIFTDSGTKLSEFDHWSNFKRKKKFAQYEFASKSFRLVTDNEINKSPKVKEIFIVKERK